MVGVVIRPDRYEQYRDMVARVAALTARARPALREVLPQHDDSEIYRRRIVEGAVQARRESPASPRDG